MISTIISRLSTSRIHSALLKNTINFSRIGISWINSASFISNVQAKPMSIWSGNNSMHLFSTISNPFHFREMQTIPAPNFPLVRFMNRNARRPKKANHGKRPVCHARRRIKKQMVKSRAYRKKIFGFW